MCTLFLVLQCNEGNEEMKPDKLRNFPKTHIAKGILLHMDLFYWDHIVKINIDVTPIQNFL